MSQQKNNKKDNKDLVKKNNGVSIFDNNDNIDTTQNVERSISINNNGEQIEVDTKLSKLDSFFARKLSDEKIEITYTNRKRTKGYAPVIFAIILFSGLLFTNILCQVRLDAVGNEMASMKSELEYYKECEKEYSQKLSQKDKEVLEKYQDYIEGNMGMIKDDPEKVYVELKLEDETVVVEKEAEKNGWTTMLSSVGRFFSDIFG